MFSQIFLLMHLLYPPKQMLIAWVFHPFYSLSLLTLIPLIRLLDFWTNFFYLMSSFCMANLSFDCFWYYASPSAFWTRSWVTSLFPDVSLGYSMYCMNCSIHLSGNLRVSSRDIWEEGRSYVQWLWPSLDWSQDEDTIHHITHLIHKLPKQMVFRILQRKILSFFHECFIFSILRNTHFQ